MVNIGKTAKSRFKANIFQPLTLAEMTVYHNNRAGIQRIKEINLSPSLNAIHSHPFKAGIVLFITEIVSRTIKEETADPNIFAFLNNTIQQLDHEAGNCNNLHLAFLVGFSKFLGIYPKTNYSEDFPFFDMLAGEFVSRMPLHIHFLEAPHSIALHSFLTAPFEHHAQINITTATRRALLGCLVEYFRLHLAGMAEIKSHIVLEEVMTN